MKKKFDDLDRMSLAERRDFLKLVGALAAAPLIPENIRRALAETVLGPSAEAAVTLPSLFIEVNFRDQWDFGSLFVPPSIARNYANIQGDIALFDQPIAERNNFYVTPQAQELRPHLDNIAVMELGECVLPGDESVHGHEAGNPLRSPGRSKNSGAGRMDMASVDQRPGGREAGNEILYSSTPTPLILHNYYSKTTAPDLRNGVLLRSSIRTGVHTFYHFEGNLANAQVDRFFDRDTFLKAFNGSVGAPIQTSLQKHGSVIAQMLKRIDQKYLTRMQASSTKLNQHGAKLDALGGLLKATNQTVDVALNASDLAFWKNLIPDQVICDSDDAELCRSVTGQWHVGEVFGYAFNLLASRRVRSVGIDFDMHDIHTSRTPFVMSTQGAQAGMPLARLISKLKAAGLWANTIIAMYTLDGSRSPIRDSTGQDSKNAIVLAGGAIKGGYYGDVALTPNGVSYRRPDDNGTPIAVGTTGRDLRVPAADIYKTVATAAGIPAAMINSFPDVASGKILRYMLL